MVSAFLKYYYDNLKEKELNRFIDCNTNKISIENIYEYLEIIDILENEKRLDRNNIANEYYYRGVANSKWGLEPSIMFNGLEWCEVKMIKEFKQLWPGEFNNIDSFNTIAKMQHFGLPTRLLDFTTNPLVALYFACSSGMDNDGKVFVALPLYKDHLQKYIDVAFDPIDNATKGTLNNDLAYLYTYLQMVYGLNNIYFKRPDYITEREKRQSSIFMLFANNLFNYDSGKILSNIEGTSLYMPFYDEEPKLPMLGIHNSLKKVEDKDFEQNFIEIIIPSSIKQKTLNKLSEIGIKKSFLFPEIEYTAQYLKEKYSNITNTFSAENFKEDYDF